jgi:ferredoxin-NADP reductase
MALLRRIADAVGGRTADQADRLEALGVGRPADAGMPADTASSATTDARPAAPRRLLEWQIATVKAITQETERAKTFTLELPAWQAHRAGQHYDVRLTAEDGYQAQRSYSIGSEPERVGEIDLTVELIRDGEVSTYMHDVLMPGDRIEVRGPIGGYFVWQASDPGSLGLVAGGSGVVPLMAMLRHRAAAGGRQPARLLYSSRSAGDIIYRAELDRLASAGASGAGDAGTLETSGTGAPPAVFHTLTRGAPEGWTGFTRRIDADMLREVLGPLGLNVRVFVCGPTLLVESVADALVGIGIPADRIKTERFGPTGS